MAKIILIKKILSLLLMVLALTQAKQPQKLGGVHLGAILPLCSYSPWYIKRDDGVHISEAAVRFYEGAMLTENEEVMQGAFSTITPVTRYHITKSLVPSDIPNIPPVFKQKLNGEYVKIYTPADFGIITDDSQLWTFLNSQLLLVPNAVPVLSETNP